MFTLLNHDFMNHEDQFYNLSKSKLTALKKTKSRRIPKIIVVYLLSLPSFISYEAVVQVCRALESHHVEVDTNIHLSIIFYLLITKI